MKRIFFGIVLYASLNIIFISNIFSWDNDVTHKDLSKYAAENSILSTNKGDYLKTLGFNKELLEEFTWGGVKRPVRDWLAEGANLEDTATLLEYVSGAARSYNHFHNPLKTTWWQSGLDDKITLIVPTMPYIITKDMTGQSALLWAQDSTHQGAFRNNQSEWDWSWQTVRDYFYKALTSSTNIQRQENFAKTFRGLGHQMHLVQDMTVPSHTRNDGHPEDSILGKIGVLLFETWAKEHPDIINPFASTPFIPEINLSVSNISNENMIPITQFVDTNQYNGTNPEITLSSSIGLSEYTNANFASDDTIFTENLDVNDRHYFPYPRYNTCYEMKEQTLPTGKKRKYLSKTCDGEKITNFLVPSVFHRFLSNSNRSAWKLDNTVYNDYASLLIPCAVGYSAGLLNYFFRGDIDLIPNQGSETEKGYLIQNNTDEDMEGTFEIWYDDKEGKRKYLWSSLLEIKKHDKSPNIDLQFPTDSIDKCKYMLVFKGKMGAEQGAVVGKMIDLSKDDYSAECMACSRTRIEQEMTKYTIDEQLIASSTKTMPIHKPTGSSYSENGGNIGCWEDEEHHAFYIRKTEPDQNCLKQCYSYCEHCYYEGINYNPAGRSDQQYAYDVGGMWGPKPLNACGFDNKQQVVKCTPARQVDGTYLIATWRQAEYTNGKVNYYSGTGKFGPLSATSEYSDCAGFKAWIRESFDLNWTVQATTNYSVSPETYAINNGDYEAMYLTSIEPDGNSKIATLTYWKTRVEEIPTYTYNITASSSTTFTNKDYTKTDTKTFSYAGEHKNTSSYGYLLETYTKKYRCENDVFTEVE